MCRAMLPFRSPVTVVGPFWAMLAVVIPLALSTHVAAQQRGRAIPGVPGGPTFSPRPIAVPRPVVTPQPRPQQPANGAAAIGAATNGPGQSNHSNQWHHGVPYRPGLPGRNPSIHPHYTVNYYSPPGYYHHPVYGFVPYSLAYRYGYGYGYQTTGLSATFGNNGFGNNGIGFNAGPAVGGNVGPFPVAPPLLTIPRVARRGPVLLDTRIEPRRALAPVETRLANTSQREIEVTLTDLLDPEATERFRIPAGESVTVSLERDAGADRVSVYERYDTLGRAITREVSRVIRPQIRYEITVHEWAMQSVAIDRTGKSPNVIEDSHFQGRGIGRFRLPPGNRLRGGRIDVYGAAKAAQNAGSVGPIVSGNPANFGGEVDNASKLERAVFEAQQRAMQRRRP